MLVGSLFVDRERELEFLERKWNEPGAQLIILYGRRRVGKTALIKRFLEGKPGVYHLATADSMAENIRDLGRALARFTGRDYFTDIREFTRLLLNFGREVGRKRVALVIDEFQYLTMLESGVLSKMQKAWDEGLKDTGIFVILCGSSVGMMERILEYKSPLYGRRTGQWKVSPFDIRAAARMLPGKDFEDLVKTYLVFGGVPFYLEFVGTKTTEEAIRELVLRKGEILYEEPEFLLREEFREPRTYKLVLKGLALGYETLGELSGYTGLERSHLSRYLDILQRLDMVGYELPYGRRKRGRYFIRDNFFAFWFRYVYPNLSDLELGHVEEVWERIERDINAYYGMMFERLVREMLSLRIIDFGQRSVHRWWHKGEEIDAIAELDGGFLFVEVKWKKLSGKEAKRILEGLRRKADRFDGEKRFLLVARKIEDKTDGMLDLEDLRTLVEGDGISPAPR
ncbi:ATP-binding protein [Thermococcus sp. ES12]|uniref:ATP-binding protein n=1 Tax=Thermococcus sp. ES12 TaxID=1638246 RepID=UPI00352FE1CC